MQSLRPRRRIEDRATPPAVHTCRDCGYHLQLKRRHVSPVYRGAMAPAAVEFYQCPACDSGFMIDPATARFKRWDPDDCE